MNSSQSSLSPWNAPTGRNMSETQRRRELPTVARGAIDRHHARIHGWWGSEGKTQTQASAASSCCVRFYSAPPRVVLVYWAMIRGSAGFGGERQSKSGV